MAHNQGFTKVNLVIEYETRYEGHIEEDEIDINDITRNLDTVKNYKLKLKKEGA
tara:strand:- start:2434 stop:2595 length:162 start_codon:yes stop_codon:yes gene_type:complete